MPAENGRPCPACAQAITRSPCAKICTVDPQVPVCTGCGRTLDEIAEWRDLGMDERTTVMRRVRRKERLDRDGFVLVPGVLSAAECERLRSLIEPAAVGKPGSRTLLREPWCRELAHRLAERSELGGLLAAGVVPWQATVFDKSIETNWLVPFHRDLSVPVARRVDHPALRGWSEKEGLWFVQPPTDDLRRMTAVRVHLDSSGEQDGALRVVPGSHQVPDPTTDRLAEPDAGDAAAAVVVAARTGDVLALSPLLLHASSKRVGEGRRRVLHLLYGPRIASFGLAPPPTA